MGFVVPGKSNSLATALGSIGTSLLNRGKQEHENKQINDAFTKINTPGTSQMDILKTLGSLNVSPEKQKLLFEGLKMSQDVAEKAKELQLGEQARINASRLAGIDPQETIGLSASEINAINKTRNPKGSLGEKPVPPEITKVMNQIIQSNPNANAVDLGVLMDEAGIPSGYSQPRLDRIQEQEKIKNTPSKYEESVAGQQAKSDVDYYDKLQESRGSARNKIFGLNEAEKLVDQGASGGLVDQLFERAGLPQYTSSNRRELAALKKSQMTDLKNILGSQFSQVEFKTLEASYFNENYSKPANKAIIANQRFLESLKEREGEIADQLIANNGGKMVPNLHSKVNSQMAKEYQNAVPVIKQNADVIRHDPAYLKDTFTFKLSPGNALMFAPDGSPLDVPPNQVDEAKKLGATF